jgi:uncharacterized metal-binding protein
MSSKDSCCAPQPRKEATCCEAGQVNICLACSGGSNVGQMTNEVAKRLDVAGDAKFFCLAGVGGHVSGMVASVKGADRVLVLDGCPVGCAKKCTDAAGISGYEYLVVTELGIQKKHDFDLPEKDVEKVLLAARDKLAIAVEPSK